MEVKKAIEKIKREFDENINSHVFLVETNDLERALYDVKDIIGDAVAKDDPNTRNQIMNETYLEEIIIRGDGKTITNDNIYELQDRIKTKPILSDYMTYIILPAENLHESASNKLLKTIEEPNVNVIGFLITKNRDLLLPTIKSRCEIISFVYADVQTTVEINPEVLEITKKLVHAMENQDHVAYYKTKIDDLVKENSQTVENLIKDYYNMACNLKHLTELDVKTVEFIRNNNSFEKLIKKTKYLNCFLNKLNQNMNADLLFEKMFFDLRDVK